MIVPMMPTGPCPAKIMIVGEAPGADEERIGKPFIGASGFELDRMLGEAGILRSECFITNVSRVRPPHNDIGNFIDFRKTCPGPTYIKRNGIWIDKPIVDGIAKLEQEIALCKPDLVIALGNLSLWALTGNWGIKNWRGSSIQASMNGCEFVVVPTYHPAAVLRQWNWRPYVITDLRRAAKILRDGLAVPHYNFIIRPQLDKVASTIERLLRRADEGPLHLSPDIETRHGHIDCIGFAWSKTEAISIPFLIYGGTPYWSESEELEVLTLIRRLAKHPNIYVSGQNWSYDAQYIFRHWGITFRLGLDTMVTHHLLFPGTDKSLDVLSSLYCDYHLFWKEDNKEANLKQDDDKRWVYNATDCIRTYEIAEVLAAQVKAQGFEEQCIFQHQQWWRTFVTMVRGVRVDHAAKAKLSHTLLTEYQDRERWVNEILGHPLNPKSPKQMKELFYGDFKLPPVIKRGTGAPTLDDEALDKLCIKEPLIRPLVRRIREMRSLGVFRSTFVEARPDTDGRMRSSYNIAGTETFRLSSSQNPFGSGLNLQNIPKGDDPDARRDPDELVLPNVRQLFIPDPGYEIFDMDLDSADVRILTWEADEPEMKQWFKDGKKPYVEVMKEYYHDQSLTKKSPKYTQFKSLCHGTNYLGKPSGLAGRVGLIVHEVERIQKWYFGKFPRIAAYQEALKRQVEQRRFVKNPFGYRRYYFDRIEGTIFNQAIAWIPQSSVGLLINHIWAKIVDECPEVQILLQVHDSLVGQYPIELRDVIRPKLLEVSKIVIPYADPLIIPTGFVTSDKSWGECG